MAQLVTGIILQGGETVQESSHSLSPWASYLTSLDAVLSSGKWCNNSTIVPVTCNNPCYYKD